MRKYSAEIRKTNVIAISNDDRHEKRRLEGFKVLGYNPDGILLSEMFTETYEDALNIKRQIESGEYY